MNIIEQTLNRPFRAVDILYILIALVIWFIVWHLIIVKLFNKCNFISGLMDEGPIRAPLISFCLLIMLCIFVVLFIASIQAALLYGAKMILVLLLFWGGLIALFVLLIRHIRK